MQVRKLLQEDDAVSPVIGVILMVAITVILAAVIASFVLGLGNQAQETTPQASFTWDYNQSGYNVSVTHDGGDSIKVNELFIRGSGFNDSENQALPSSNTKAGSANPSNSGSGDYMVSAGEWFGSTSGTKGSASAVVAGDSVTVHVDSDYELRVVFQAQEGDNSATLGKDSGPDA